MQQQRNKRRGLRRLECECGAVIYATWAQLEQHGRPACSCGGGEFMPDDLELAMALGLKTAPVVVEYQTQFASVSHGQAGPGRALRNVGAQFEDPSAIAAARVERARRDRALSNRLGALAPAADPMPF